MLLKFSLLLLTTCLIGISESKAYSSDDTVVLEAALDDHHDTKANGRNMPEIDEENCVTNSGLPGNCESVQDCFPRLFPVDPTENDTPKASGGVYNQNLVSILLENSGFCGDSANETISGPYSSDKKFHVCCPIVKAPPPGSYPLDNVTAPSNETSEIKRSCGSIRVDQSVLPNNPKIVGGRPAVLGEYPWVVAMIRRGQQFCGGSLIDDRNVLTAAHCVEFMNKHDVAALRLNIGDLDISSNSETAHAERRARRVLFHKGFTMKNLAHDIALIHLDRPVTFSDTIQPVCLHNGAPPYDTGKSFADVSGWGTTSSGGSQSSKLLAVTIRVMPNTECNQKYAKANKMVGPGMVCAGSEGKDSCQGDSGGPLVTDPRSQAKQIGIVSWGIGCASYPGVYTRVDKYMRWINKNKQK